MRVPLLVLLLCALATGSVRAQQTVTPLLPDSVAQYAVEFYNAETTTRLSGGARFGPETVIRGGIALLGGTLNVEGVVEGDVVVINGDLRVHGPGARVHGGATVIGGTASINSPGAVAGPVRSYREPLRYRHAGAGIVLVPDPEQGLSAGREFGFGRTDLLIASHGAYNRVEGLPVAIGPRIRFGGPHPTTARAVLIARTAAAAELNLKRFGYDVRAEQLVAPSLGLSLGLRLYSEIAAIESWGLSDRESALATVLLHEDHRDHFEREGWSLYAALTAPGAPWRLELAYRDEEHVATPAADPFTVLNRNDSWRPEVAIAEGAVRSIAVRGTYDTRNEPTDPSAGWLVTGEIDHGLGGSLDDVGRDPLATPAARTGYRSAHFDVRRYARLSPYARLGIRVVAAGSLDARPLPPQQQHALGGEGSLPGYSRFEFDCGARASTIELRGDRLYPYYGCDQLALVQLEYQAGFPFARRLAEAAGISGSIGQLVRWVAFFDAGRAWVEPQARNGRLGGNDDFSADAGLGLRVGPTGAYWAVPLSGRGGALNFFVRLGPRI